MSTSKLLKAVKWGSIGSATVVGTGLTFAFVTSPVAVPSTAYRNFSPNVDRSKHIQRLKSENFDLVVIGGGATGASVALDGASRGLKVALLEREDFSSGTSSRSTKLLHGGVRYLKDAILKADLKAFEMVYDALKERSHMLKSHPFICHPVGILLPVYSYFDLIQNYIGIKLYELFGNIATVFSPGLPDSYRLSRKGCVHAYPLINTDNLKGGIYYFDGQHNDSRINAQIVLTAATPNYIDGWSDSAVANYAEVTGFSKDDSGKINGVIIKDRMDSDKQFKVNGKVVINCAGPFADESRLKANGSARELITTSSGTHLMLPGTYSSESCGLLIPQTKDGRVLFCLPWEGETCIGTTDVATKVTDAPQPTGDEVEFIVSEISKYINVSANDLRKDIKAAWSGLRPLVKDPSAKDTAKLSRDFEVIHDPSSGLISVLGGKWTTARLMAEAAVNKALKIGDIPAQYACRTWGLKLVGAHAPEGVDYPQLIIKLQRDFGLSGDDASYLARNYGMDAVDLCDKGKREKTLRPILPNQPFMLCELKWAFEKEMAQTVADAIARRTRMAFLDPEATSAVLPQIVDYIGNWKGWSTEKRLAEISKAEKFLMTMTYTQKKAIVEGL